jgi:hypothetical protein
MESKYAEEGRVPVEVDIYRDLDGGGKGRSFGIWSTSTKAVLLDRQRRC